MAISRTNSIAAQNTFSSPLTLTDGAILTLTGTWAGTISFQRKAKDGNWYDVTNNSGAATTFTTNGTYAIDPRGAVADYRWGFKTGAYTSGTCVGFLEAGR
jgi:hypothetical protein